MVTPTYYDACSLAYQAENRAPGCTTMAAHVGPQVDALMADPLRSHYVSELGVLEFRNTLAKLCRSTTPESAALGTDWMSAAVTELMGRIARSEISVVRTEPRMYLHATSLVDLAARAGIAFGTWDTVHVLDAAPTWNDWIVQAFNVCPDPASYTGDRLSVLEKLLVQALKGRQ